MNVGELRARMADLPDDMEVRAIYWTGTCDKALPIVDAVSVRGKYESEAWSIPDDATYPYLELR